MLDLQTSSDPFHHLCARFSGYVTLGAIDAAAPFVRYGSLFEPHGEACVVIAEVAPGTMIDLEATGVVHFLLQRLLSPTTADVRIVGPGRLGARPAYMTTALAEGKVRYFDTWEAAVSAPARHAAVVAPRADYDSASYDLAA